MIKKLQLEDICEIVEVNPEQYIAKASFLSYYEEASDDSSLPLMGLKVKEKIFNLDKVFDNNTKTKVLNELLEKFLNKEECEERPERFIYEFGWIEQPTEEDMRKVITKIMMLGNKIAVDSRIGPAHCIVFSDEYRIFFDKINKYRSLESIKW